MKYFRLRLLLDRINRNMSAIQPSTISDSRKLRITIITIVPTVVIKLWISSVKLLFSASRDRIHIVRKMTHQLPMGMGVEIRQWKRLRMIKEIFSYFLYNLLRRFHHQAVIPQRGRCSHRIYITPP